MFILQNYIINVKININTFVFNDTFIIVIILKVYSNFNLCLVSTLYNGFSYKSFVQID